MTLEEKVPLLERAVQVAQRHKLPSVEAAALHQWGDALFAYGDYAQAVEKTLRAVELFESAKASAPRWRGR